MSRSKNPNPYVVAMANSAPVEQPAAPAVQQSAPVTTATTAQSYSGSTGSPTPATQQQPVVQQQPASGVSSANTTRTYNGVTYDTSRDYAGEALTAINGVGGAYDPDVYTAVQNAYNARNAKIADNQAHYDAQGIGTADAAGQQMADYLNRYQVQNAIPQQPVVQQQQPAIPQVQSQIPLQQLQSNAQQSAQQQKISGVDFSSLRTLLDDWLKTAQQQAGLNTDYTVQQGVTELQRAQEDAQPQFDEQYSQIARDEAIARDNSALYAAARGDRGGIGQAQYDAIAATAAANRATVRSAQTKLATDTQRQIADLRLQGDFKKASEYLNLTQQYLSQLMSLQQFAISTNLDVARFNASVDQWYNEYAQKLQQMQISVDQWQAEFDNSNYWNALKFNEGVRQYEQDYAESVRQADREFAYKLDRAEQDDYQWYQEFQRLLDRDQVSYDQWAQEFQRLLNRDAYSNERDRIEDEFRERQFDRTLDRDRVSDEQWAMRFNEDSRQFWEQLNRTAAQRNQSALADYAEMLVKQGVMPDSETLSALGWNQSAIQSYVDVIQSQQYMDALVSMSKVSGANAASSETGDISDILGIDDSSGISSFYTAKPNLSATNVNTALDTGEITEGVRQAYAYYYGESYFNRYSDELSSTAKGYLNAFTSGRLSSGQMEERFEQFQQDLANGIIQPTEADYIIRQTQQQATQIARTTQGRVSSILDVAANEIGYHETGNNNTIYGKWYNGGELQGQAWCMMYVDWVFDQAGMYDLLPVKTASTTVFANAAKKANNWHTNGDYQAGDVVIFDYDKTDGKMNHVGIIKEVKEDGTIITIEGNTSDQVAERTYKPKTANYDKIAGTFRPDYGSMSGGTGAQPKYQRDILPTTPVSGASTQQQQPSTPTTQTPQQATTSTPSRQQIYDTLYDSYFGKAQTGVGMSTAKFNELKTGLKEAIDRGDRASMDSLLFVQKSLLNDAQRREIIEFVISELS